MTILGFFLLFISAGLLLFSPLNAVAQLAADKHTFEVASIKPSSPNGGSSSWSWDFGRLTVRNMSVKQLITRAYNIRRYQVPGGPGWLASDRWDIVAKLDLNGPTPPSARESSEWIPTAMQALLADRFKLVMHEETKRMPGYALVVARGGFKLQKVDPEGTTQSRVAGPKLTATRISMSGLAEELSGIMSSTVADMTGLGGVYNLRLTWAVDTPDPTDLATGPSIFTALQEQLGLRLESRPLPTKMFVIESAEKPTEN